VCVSSASTGLCGGQRAIAVPTATGPTRPRGVSPWAYSPRKKCWFLRRIRATFVHPIPSWICPSWTWLPAALLVIAVVASHLARWTRVPDIIVLLLIGLGPILKWVDRGNFQVIIRILGMLPLILILFEGGLELRLKQPIRYSPGGILLAIVSYGLPLELIAAVAKFTLPMALDGALLGAVLASTSAAVVPPAIQQIDAAEPIKVTVTLESSLARLLRYLPSKP